MMGWPKEELAKMLEVCDFLDENGYEILSEQLRVAYENNGGE